MKTDREQLTTEAMQPGAVMSLLHREDAVFRRLEGLAARQRDLVVGSDMQPLLGLLTDRRRLSAELTEITRELAPVRRQWATVRSRLAPSERAEADELISQAGRRLRRLMAGDEEDARKLAVRKQAVAQTLSETGSAACALSAYRGATERAVRFDCTDLTQ